jgi:hypothetical protein
VDVATASFEALSCDSSDLPWEASIVSFPETTKVISVSVPFGQSAVFDDLDLAE